MNRGYVVILMSVKYAAGTGESVQQVSARRLAKQSDKVGPTVKVTLHKQNSRLIHFHGSSESGPLQLSEHVSAIFITVAFPSGSILKALRVCPTSPFPASRGVLEARRTFLLQPCLQVDIHNNLGTCQNSLLREVLCG